MREHPFCGRFLGDELEINNKARIRLSGFSSELEIKLE
jgi:hypothetical protein